MAPSATRAAMILLATLVSAPACRAEAGAVPPCVISGTPFQAAYAQQLSSGTDHETYDLDAHGYHFIPRINMTVCSVGYTSPATPPGRYRFQIRDINCTPGVLLSVAFDPAALAFPPLGIPYTTHQPVTPTPLLAGCTYEIRRTALDISQTYQRTGRVLTGQSPFLRGPHSIDTPLMSILSTKLVGGGGPVSNRVLPYIDFGTY
ncbi:hypothetical protein KAK07_19745 [Ideonella sp. 4Y16]|uniref:hypothetical protein n=1 Tax=Ideonella alba TaxID=2824118 RepID=UPI001B3973E6|nr:hypothetical protein [Ideonella alba]MBQ0945583.1 hypothetical protein [Ideonella alba]